ncbi:hypothetical protein [Armatimonas sp.]|uniref:hypothetical protein n=1 Tax=Armatimonas sp. TaxID=1872638 RepID=UPI00286BED4C|nr:hypothetical protein [Armatimonas sp.]
MSRKDEILGALDTALRERMPADNTALHAALAQFKQEQYQAPVRIAPVRRWLALGGGTVLAGAAALGFFMVRVPEPSHLPRPRASPPPLPREERTAREEGASRAVAKARGRWNPSEKWQPIATPPTPPPIFRPIGDDLTYLSAEGFDAYTQRVAAFVRSDVRSLKLQLPEVKGADSFVEVPLPQLAASDTAADSAALRRYQDEKGISDSRLQKRVTLAKKAVSFGDLLDAIAKETGVNISATRSVADDKLTVFCKDKPLRELMRMITQHFGFVWERTGSEPQFVYRLKQPLRNQFLEEELRNKDKNEALLALDREMESLKKYFEMSPEETRAAAESAQGKEKEKLEMLGGIGWGPSRLYAGLEADDQAALQAGKQLLFGSNGRDISKELESNTLNALTGHAFISEDGITMSSSRKETPGEKVKGKSPVEAGAKPIMMLQMQRDEVGEVSLMAHTGFSQGKGAAMSGIPMAVGISPSASSPKNAEANAAKKKAPGFQKPTELTGAHRPHEIWRDGKKTSEEVWTSADALEAIHKATGKDVMGDYFTRLVPHKNEKGPLFDVLARTCDPLRLRWAESDGWLTFRSTDFFNMRLKEVPGRLLEKWAAQRKTNASLTPDDLREISRLTDDQLDASSMREGAKALYGLEEWDWVSTSNVRPIWRFYDSLPTNLRTALTSEKGVGFSQLAPDARQKFILAAYQHNKTMLGKIQQGSVPEVFLKALQSSASLKLSLPAAGAEKKPGETAFLFDFMLPTDSGEKLMKMQIGPGSTSISTPD